jgi:signal transduction histidine kinase
MPPRHCLLVVDDEPEVVRSLKDLLRFDYRVLGAGRSKDALDIIETEPVHIVMSDQRMPDMSGVEFLERVRERHPDIVRLLFTGYADIKAVIDAINHGHIFRYIAKPWDTDELMAVLRQAAERYDLLAERKQLLAELQEKNRRLGALNTELQQASDLKEAFIKVASHELRTPLTIVLGLADLARQTDGVGQPMGQWLDHIYTGTQRLNDLVQQMTKLLAAGRFERSLVRRETSLAELLQAAAAELAPFVQKRKQTLVVDAPGDLGAIFVDAAKLRDSVEHLLLNAIKFTPDGGRIDLSARRLPDHGVEIRVADNGVGMDRASVERLFQPFFTGFDVSRHRSGVFEFERRGLGLGLSLVKAFVEMHGGRLRAESELGRGSVFTITLPPASDA